MRSEKIWEIGTIFSSLISSLSPMFVPFFFSHLNILSHPCMSSFFFSSQFPTFSHHINLPIFSHLKFNSHPHLSLFVSFFFFHLNFPLYLNHLYLPFFLLFKKKKKISNSLSLSHTYLFFFFFFSS